MFRVSRRVDYGLRLLIALAESPSTVSQPTSQLSEKLGIPLAFLHQIGRSLIQAGLLKASPGPGGGLRLNRAPDSISLRQVLEVLEGPIRLNNCTEQSDDCTPENPCTTHLVWQDVEDTLINHLAGVHLDHLAASGHTVEQEFSAVPNYRS